VKNSKLSAVDLRSCHTITNRETPFILIISKWEELVSSLIKCAEIVKFPSAYLIGLGALENPVLGNYNFKEKKHEPKVFQGLYELTNLTGNVIRQDNQYVAHVHVTLSNLEDHSCNAITGHLMESPIGMFAEIMINPFASSVERKFDHTLQSVIIQTSLD